MVVKLILSLLRPAKKQGAEPEEAPAFDADAALARYLERKAAGEVDMSIPEPPARPVFGRKINPD